MSVITVIVFFIYLYRSCCLLILCEGLRFAEHCILYLFISINYYFVPLKLRSTSENFHMLSMEGELLPIQIDLTKILLCDVLEINWHNIKIHHHNKPLHLSQDISIALKDRIRS